MSNKESDGRQEKREFRPLPMDEESKRRLWTAVKEKKPTPDHVLETQLRDPRIPKDEIVHYAARRIAELEAEVKRYRKALAKIARSSCPRCGDRSVQQIARDAMREKEKECD